MADIKVQNGKGSSAGKGQSATVGGVVDVGATLNDRPTWDTATITRAEKNDRQPDYVYSLRGSTGVSNSTAPLDFSIDTNQVEVVDRSVAAFRAIKDPFLRALVFKDEERTQLRPFNELQIHLEEQLRHGAIEISGRMINFAGDALRFLPPENYWRHEIKDERWRGFFKVCGDVLTAAIGTATPLRREGPSMFSSRGRAH